MNDSGSSSAVIPFLVGKMKNKHQTAVQYTSITRIPLMPHL